MKNRFFSGLLACIACLLLCTVAHAESDYGIYIYDYAIYNDGKNIRTDNTLVSGDLKVSAVINNDTAEHAENIAVIAAVFDTKDKLLTLNSVIIDVRKNSSVKILNLPISVPDIDLTNAQLRLFIWDSMKNAQPLMENPVVFPEKLSSLIVYPAPEGITASDMYSVRLSEDGGKTWTNSFTYKTECLDKSVDSAYYSDYIGGFTASFTNFEMKDDTPITVEITKLWGDPIKSADVKPHSKNIANVVDGNKVIFTITEPALLAVEIDGYPNNGKTDHSICIFANAPMEDVPDMNDPTVKVLYPGDEIPPYNDESWSTLYFTPGVYNIGAGYTAMPNKKFYLAGGAYVTGSFADLDPEIRDGSTRLKPSPGGSGAKVYGYGILSGTGINWLDGNTNPAYDVKIRHAIDLMNNKVALEGVTILDTANHAIMMAGWAGNANAATIRNVKVLNWRRNGDGIHVFCHGVIDNCFLRTQDDSIYIASGTQNEDKLVPVEPIPQTISNLVTWNDVNGSAFIFSAGGGGGNTTLSNCDVLYNRCVFALDTPISRGSGGYVFNLRQQNTGAIMANVSVSDIRVEDPLYGAIINPKMWNRNLQRKGIFFLNMQSDTNTGSVFTNISFKNITVDAFVTNEDNPSAPVRQNIFNGVSETSKMGNISIENLTIGGTKITNENAEDFNFVFINADDVEFK